MTFIPRHMANNIWSIIPFMNPDDTEPVALEEVKSWLSITFIDDDALLTALIQHCRDGVEQFCNISIIAKTYTLNADLFEEVEIPYGPIQSISSVMIRNGSTYIVDTDYTIDGDMGSYMRFCPVNGGRYKIVYVTAGLDLTNYQSLKLDLLRIIAYCYEHRGDEALNSLESGIGRPKSLDEALELFASKYKRMCWI